MHLKIKNRIEQELSSYASTFDQRYSLSKISPVLYKYIREFILRPGKRVRPTLFVIGYLGFSEKIAPGLYSSALSIELLHDFMLVHDDIIDKSDTRRGKPSMHKMLNGYLKKYPGIKFNGEDLAIVAGDVMYAMGMDAFLSIKEEPGRKETAMRKLIQAALYTGSGEFIELLCGVKELEKLTQGDIYKIYDYKTANYTFASPLAVGAILAGADKKETDILFKYGIYLGRAFQIKDDILGLFGDEKKLGKSILTDLKEAKKTLLIWRAFNRSGKLDKAKIRKILGRKDIGMADLKIMRGIINRSGALDYTKKEILRFMRQAQELIATSKIKPDYKKALWAYSQDMLNL